MNQSPLSKTAHRRAFTLVELLVSMTVFSVIVVALANLVGAVSSGWTRSQESMDNFSAARALLGSLDRDLASAVVRPDLPAFSDNGTAGRGMAAPISFYTRQFGQTAYDPDGRALTYVSYAWSKTDGRRLFERLSHPQSYHDSLDWQNAFLFSNAAPKLIFDPAQTSQLSDGVYGVASQFINADGSLADQFNPPAAAAAKSRAIRVSLLIVSREADRLANDLGVSDRLELDFHTAAAASSSLTAKTAWDKLIAGRLNCPSKILAGIRTYEKIIALNPSAASLGHVQISSDPDF